MVNTDKASESRRVASSDDLEVSAYLEIAQEKGSATSGPEGSLDATREAVLVVDFGSQYSLLIARRVRECNVYSEIVPYDAPWEKVAHLKPKGIILSGGPASVYDADAPLAPPWVYEQGIPVLGICYGMQVLSHQLGGQVAPTKTREYGHAVLYQNVAEHPLLEGLPPSMPVWMSHGDQITSLPPGFQSLAYTDSSPVAAMGSDSGFYGLQFHPEVVHTPQGTALVRNFLFNVCGCTGSWTPGNFVAESLQRIREQVGTGQVICALSGGVDSAVAATLVHQAIGDQLTCIFVNNGLMRREEPERVDRTFRQHLKMNLIHVDAADRFVTS